MTRLRVLLSRLVALVGGRRREDELADEIATHIALLTDEHLARGMSPDEAHRAAHLAFGGVTQTREAFRRQRVLPSLDTLGQDLRHAVRRLRGRPGGAWAGVLLLALGIGLASAMFTLLDALVLRPAPFRDAASLVRVGIGRADNYQVNVPLPVIRAWREAGGFTAVHAVAQQPLAFDDDGDGTAVPGARVTPALFGDLGAEPLLGRTFTDEEAQSGADDVLLISESLWRARYGADPAILQRRVPIAGGSAVVVGVMPGSFTFPFSRTAAWRPLSLDHPPANVAMAYTYARLAPHVPRDDAARLAAAVVHDLDPQGTAQGVAQGVVLRGVGDDLLDDYSAGTLQVASLGVALVFIVLCANVMALMLARLDTRRREFALCAVLGASRGRLLRQACWEQVLIGMAGGLLGLGVAVAMVSLARAFLPEAILLRTLNPLDFDLRAFGATALVSLIAVLGVGLLPAWLGTRHGSTAAERLTTRYGSTDRRTGRMTSVLVVIELALAVALCVAGGVQLRSFVNLLAEDRGIDADRLTAYDVTFPRDRFGDARARYAVAEHVRVMAAQLEGMEGATLSTGEPPSGGALYFYDVVSDQPAAQPVKMVMHGFAVTPEFFEVYGVRMREGRTFAPGDPEGTVVVSASLASEVLGDGPAVGRTMRFDDRAFHIVGVTEEIRNPLLDPRSDEPELFEVLVPSRSDNGALALGVRRVTVTTRCGGRCPPAEQVRVQLQAAAAGAVVGVGRPISDAYAAALERPRTGAVLAVAFAAVGLLAVGAGLFAVLTRVAAQRYREFGVRVALGATPRDIRRLVHANTAQIGVAGLACGVLLSWMLGRVLAAVQHDVRLGDPSIWGAVLAAVAATMVVAAWRPARQAMRADPVTLLRHD